MSLLSLLLVLAPLAAGEPGQTAAPSLQRILSSHGAALGSAFTAAAPSPDAIDYNPAGSAGLKSPLMSATYLRGFANSYYAALRHYHPRGPLVLMGSLYQYNAGDVTIVQTDGTSFKTTAEVDTVVSAGASMRLPFAPALSVGVLYKYGRLKLIEFYRATAHVFDFGARLKTPIKGLSLGGSYQNVGAGISFLNEKSPPPTTWRLGAAYDLDWLSAYKAFPTFIDLRSYNVRSYFDAVKVRDQDISPRLGVELAFQMPFQNELAVRAGHIFNRVEEGFTFGFGFRQVAWSFDYSLGSVRSLRMRHQATLSYWWGRRPEEFD